MARSLKQRKLAGAPRCEAAPAWLLPLSPPEGFLGLVEDVAPRQADVVKVAIGPLGQLAAAAIALAPDLQRVANRLEKARNMMICHRFMGASRHFQLLKLIFES